MSVFYRVRISGHSTSLVLGPVPIASWESIISFSDVNSNGKAREYCKHLENSVITKNIFRS